MFDVSDPRNPVLKGKLANAIFENEAMTMGERRLANGKIQRFLLLGNDLVQASVGPGGIQRGRPDGQQLLIVDVTDPADPRIVGSTPESGPGMASTSTHTVACMNVGCTVAYGAGNNQKFSIFDLSDITKPRQVKESPSPAAGKNPVFTNGSGHHWNVDGAGIAQHAGSGGTALFDISDPLNPLALNGTDANGTKTPFNDFIHHNVQRPNAKAFAPGRAPSVEAGNVALITEEDYFNDGDEVACDKAGTFQTWEVPDLDGAAYRAGNPKLDPDKGTLRPLDTINPPNSPGGGASTPAGGFCSAHWFDYHQSGVIAEGFYQQGLRLINVRNARDLKQEGFFTGGGTEVWDAYWAPQRDKDGAVVPGMKTNLVYTVDAARGLEVFSVRNLPPDLKVTGDNGSSGSFPETVSAAAAGTAGSGSAPGGASGSGGGIGPTGKRCSAPTSRFLRTSRIDGRGLRLRGTAAGRSCRVKAVRVAVGRKTGKRCRFLQANGRFGALRSCLRTQYLPAKGTTKWTFARALRLPKASYMLWSRAIDTAGNVERKAARRNLLQRRVAARRG